MRKFSFQQFCFGVLLSAALGLTLAFAAPQNQSPVTPDALAQAAEKAVLAQDFDALKPLVSGDAVPQFAWIKETTTKDWQAGVLAIPLATEASADAKLDGIRTSLAVFHAWHTCESDGDHVHRLVNTPDGLKLGAEIPETETGGFRVRDHNLRVTLDVPQKNAQFQDTVTLERTAETNPGFALLRLASAYKVSKMTLQGEPMAYQQVGGLLAFRPPNAKKFEIEMEYAGHVDHKGSDYIRENEATLNSYWYPHIARLPATATVTAAAPPDWTPIAQGELQKETTDAAGAMTRTFRNDIPTCFFTLDMGKYTVTTRKTDGRSLSAYLLAPNPKLAQNSLDTLEKSLRFFDTTFGKFPYSRYTLVETQGPFGGALESYSFATFGPGAMQDTVVHELSHTWWGGVVPCAYTRSMWNESFAEYSDGLYHRVALKEAERGLPPMARRGIANAFRQFTMLNAHDTSDNRQAGVGYGKGPLVLRVLEDEIGLETMKKCCAAFVRGHIKGEAAEWPEFEGVVNKVTGKDYHWFFAQWAERVGLPAAHLENVIMKRNGANYTVEGDFVQTGETYRMHVPVRVETADGAVTERFETRGPRTHFRLNAPAAPTQLRIDPIGILPISVPAANVNALNHDFK